MRQEDSELLITLLVSKRSSAVASLNTEINNCCVTVDRLEGFSVFRVNGAPDGNL